MCLSLPYKVLEKKKSFILVDFQGKKKKVNSLIKVKKGDFILIQNNCIVKKMAKKEAIEILKLIE